MMKWKKTREPRPPDDRSHRIDAYSGSSGIFRTTGDFEFISQTPVIQSGIPRAVLSKPSDEPSSRTARGDEANAKVNKMNITGPVGLDRKVGDGGGGGGGFETVAIVVNRKKSSGERSANEVRKNEKAAVGAGSVLATFKGEAGATSSSDEGAMPTYGAMPLDRDNTIYESTPAFRLEPILTSDNISSAINGSKTTITINSEPVPSRVNGATTLLVKGPPPQHSPPPPPPPPAYRKPVTNGRNPGATTLVINGDAKHGYTSDGSASRGRSPQAMSEVNSGIENGSNVSPSVSPLSRASSNRTTDTEQSSATGSTFYLTGGVGSPFTPLGSTTRLIAQDRVKDKFKADTGWLPAWGTVFTILSLVVGIGNVVRLPRVVAMHGGGPFLIVYVLIMLVLGIPLVFLEIGLGQFCEEGTTKLWRAVPLFKGVGYVKVLASMLMSIYYPILMTISLFYMVWSAKGLPFPECVQTFTGLDYSHNLTGEDCLSSTFLRPPKDDGMWFGVNVALMFLIWAIVMLCMFRHRQSFRLATYMTVVPIILIMVALLVESIVRDSEAEGLNILFTFDWNVLLNIEVWYFATIQMFFSTHLGFGNIVTSAGRLYPQSNAFWTATMFIFANLAMGLVSVLIVYYYIGLLNIDPTMIKMPEVFLFTLFYEAVTTFITPNSEVWAAFAYLAFVLSGLSAMLSLVFTILEVMTIELGKKVRWEWWQKTGIVCAVGFLIGVPSLLPYELELVHILDHYVIGRIVIASTILELIGICWIYGCGTLYTDFEFILGYRLNPIWKVIWWITPVIFLVLEIWSLVSLPLTGLMEDNDDQIWVFATGWSLYLLSWVIIIATAIRQVTKQIDYNLSEKLLGTLKPSRKWGPVDTMYRHNWHQWRNQSSAPGERDYTLKRRGTKDYTHTLKRTRSPQGMHFQTTLSPANTLRSNRGVDKLPYTVQDVGDHVCWRGQNGGLETVKHDGAMGNDNGTKVDLRRSDSKY